MEDKLLKWFESMKTEGISPADLISNLYEEYSDKVLKMPEYLISRKNGLNMIESKLATLLSQDIKNKGLEALLARIECRKEKKPSIFFKKRSKKDCKTEPDLKKKAKL